MSDAFGTYRGVGRIHEGIDLDLYGMHHSTIFAACLIWWGSSYRKSASQ